MIKYYHLLSSLLLSLFHHAATSSIILYIIMISACWITLSLFCHNYYYHSNHILSPPSVSHSLDSTFENVVANAAVSPLSYQMNWLNLIMKHRGTQILQTCDSRNKSFKCFKLLWPFLYCEGNPSVTSGFPSQKVSKAAGTTLRSIVEVSII